MDHGNTGSLTVIQVTSSTSSSGGTRQVLLLSEGLRQRGHRVFFCAVEDSPVLRQARDLGFDGLELGRKSLRRMWADSRRLRRAARELDADVVHAHHTPGHNLALFATFGGGFPPVVANRGVIFAPRFTAKFKNRRTAAVITNSLAAKRVLVDAGVPCEKVTVVYNAKEPADVAAISRKAPELRRELAIGAGPVIGAVGGGNPRKGFEHLVSAAPHILARHPGAVFVLVGGGIEALAPKIAELGLSGRFRLTGYRTDAVEIMGLFDVFVLPSLTESCPNVLLEALSLGIPAVCSDVGGVREILEGGSLGELVAPADPDALAGRVCAILDNPAGARAKGTLGREAVARRFTLSNKVEGTVRVYEGLIARHLHGFRASARASVHPSPHHNSS